MNYSGNSLKLNKGNNTNKFVVPEVSELLELTLQYVQFCSVATTFHLV
jgi:hypothetical protein